MEIYCFSYFIAKSGLREPLRQALLALVEPTNQEPGCITYKLLVDKANPDHFIMLEHFRSVKEFAAHETQVYIQDFIKNEMHQLCAKVGWHEAVEL
ncbi:MAG: antibiotic biosynthesis monooxygenase [Gammaproteobacteria bacterium]|nr:antibiotic biosynthesis monooxygenase [Gammaproteobacteria bacterium]